MFQPLSKIHCKRSQEITTLPILKSKQKGLVQVAACLSYGSVLAKVYWESPARTEEHKRDILHLKEEGRRVFCVHCVFCVHGNHQSAGCVTTCPWANAVWNIAICITGAAGIVIYINTRKQTAIRTTDYKWVAKWAEAATLLVKTRLSSSTCIFI